MNIKKDQKFSKEIKETLDTSLCDYDIIIRSTEHVKIDINSSCFTMYFERDGLRDLSISFIFEFSNTLKINIHSKLVTNVSSINFVNIADKRERDGVCCWLIEYIKSYFEKQYENINNVHNDETNKKEIFILLINTKEHFCKRLKSLIEENNLSINLKDEDIRISCIEDKYQIVIKHEADLIFSDIRFQDGKVVISCSSNKLSELYEREFEICNGPTDNVSIPLFLSDTLIDVSKVSIFRELVENKCMEGKMNYTEIISEVMVLIPQQEDLSNVVCGLMIEHNDIDKKQFKGRLDFSDNNKNYLCICILGYGDNIDLIFDIESNNSMKIINHTNLADNVLIERITKNVSNLIRNRFKITSKENIKEEMLNVEKEPTNIDCILQLLDKGGVEKGLTELINKFEEFKGKEVELQYIKRKFKGTDLFPINSEPSRLLIRKLNNENILDYIVIKVVGDGYNFDVGDILLHEDFNILILKYIDGYIRNSDISYTFIHELKDIKKLTETTENISSMLQNVLVVFCKQYIDMKKHMDNTREAVMDKQLVSEEEMKNNEFHLSLEIHKSVNFSDEVKQKIIKKVIKKVNKIINKEINKN